MGLTAPLILTDDSVRALFAHEGWPFEKLVDNVWRTWLETSHGEPVPIVVRMDTESGFVRFAVVPFLASPKDTAQATALYERLLVLNRGMTLAKYSIDDDLDVFLSVEYPAVALDVSEFHDALQALGHYLARDLRELRALAGAD